MVPDDPCEGLRASLALRATEKLQAGTLIGPYRGAVGSSEELEILKVETPGNGQRKAF